MNYEIALKWADALNSHKYIQGTKSLRNGNQFCCLGVLCDISELGEWASDNSYLGNKCYLPEAVMKWADIRTSDAMFSENSVDNSYDTLMFMNDRKWSFFRIATEIIDKWEFL